MKTMSTLGWIIFIFGITLLISGVGRLSGFFEYDSVIPNKFVALIYISMGFFVMFISFFVKPKKEKVS
ncbi:MAG TPA: hypothetical protein DEB37_19580 [Lysinibacillus sp.]|uniref:hypothetical protein n=1 Tax=unclassified Lysinibacillus TaxID=2636778 RepID=UPI000E956E4F|nr:hypothetical protein [Lysinibacillus sp. OF-1]WCH49651.1 hypothetical protein NV349_09810 [Lysinibacillus sp. OF-1]HBT74347.1 hypothetical protein [Lysinibacillus sp.]